MSKIEQNRAQSFDNGEQLNDLTTMAQSALTFTTSPIDGTSAGTTVLIPSTSFVQYVLLWLSPVVLLSNVSGAGTPPTISIGNNASSYNNLLGSTALTGLTTALNGLGVTLTTARRLDRNAGGIFVRVVTPSALYTSYDFTVSIVGIVYQ